VIELRSEEVTEAALTRSFRVPRTDFLPQFSVPDLHFYSSPADWQQAAREALASKGFDLGQHGQMKFFYNDRTEVLDVSGSEQELRLVEEALARVNVSPPRVSLRVMVAEIDASKATEISKLLDSFKESGLQPISLAVQEQKFEIFAITEDDAKTACRELEQKEGIDLVTFAPVETVSGRQARVFFPEAQETILIPPFHAPQGKPRSGFYFNAE
jgi:hypothetical protein